MIKVKVNEINDYTYLHGPTTQSFFSTGRSSSFCLTLGMPTPNHFGTTYVYWTTLLDNYAQSNALANVKGEPMRVSSRRVVCSIDRHMRGVREGPRRFFSYKTGPKNHKN